MTKDVTIIICMLLLTVMSSCQQDMDLYPHIEDTQVRVAMGLSVPPCFSAPTTRQSSEVTQAAGDAASFRGMTSMSLLAFSGSNLPDGASPIQVPPVNLGGISKGELTSVKNYKFYEDKPLYVGVSHAVVYAEAARTDGGDMANGVIVAPELADKVGYKLEDITFSLKSIADDNLNVYRERLAYILNDIIEAGISVDYYFTLNSERTAVERKQEVGGTRLLWKNLVGEQLVGEDDPETSLATAIDLDDDKLAHLFDSMSQLRSGSAASVLETVRSLYHVLGTYTMSAHAIQWKGSPLDGYQIKPCAMDADADVGYEKLIIDRTGMKDAIYDKIKAHFTLNASETEVLAYRTDGAYYPGEVNLPDGAIPIIYNTVSKSFAYDNAGPILPSDRLNTTSICYPASLYYTVNSPLRTRNTELHEADKLQVNTASAWKNANIAGGLWGSDKTGPGKEWQTSVQNDTRTIVLTENIHYAVAVLETSVRIASPTLQDNNRKPDGHGGTLPDPNLLAVPASGFPVTGILVGSQPDRVGWNLKSLPVPSTGGGITSYTRTIYDNAAYAPVSDTYPVVARYSQSVFSEPLRTLCLESRAWGEKDAGGNRPSALYVALEMKNTTGVSFVGADGIVPANGTFYLLAKLDLETDAANGITSVSGSGIGTTLSHVLQQGYRTQAHLTIASLKQAYNTIPDLRLTKLALGVSVDIEWHQGAVFDIK